MLIEPAVVSVEAGVRLRRSWCLEGAELGRTII